jgi:hypothetical protein
MNETDNILGGYEVEEEPGFFLTLTRVSDDAIDAGLIGEIAVGVDPGTGRVADR